MYKYFPHTDNDLASMMEVIGVKSLDELYAEVPEQIRFRGDYQLPEAMSEIEVRQLFEQLGKQNRQLTCFAGAGVYDHYTPSVIPQLLQRSEFLTSYTPYQAEISQGTLHYIFEYQSMMVELTDMDISNASMYDGTTATAEAVMMAVAAGKKQNKVLVSETIDPKTLAVVKTYAHFHGIDIVMIPALVGHASERAGGGLQRSEAFLDEPSGRVDRPTNGGITSKEALEALLAEGGVAGVLVQQPNFYGIVEDYSGFADLCHANKALFIMNGIIADYAVLKTPGEWDADIACGDAQSLGIPMQWGGPYVGYLCCTEKLIRKMPGRIVGKTIDNRGQRAFVLTLQAREQHIRRQKATSNICSNQSLMALWATVYCSLMGRQGLKEAAELSYAGAHYLCDRLLATGHFGLAYDQPFFNEFVVRYDGDVDALQRRFLDHGFFAGIKLSSVSNHEEPLPPSVSNREEPLPPFVSNREEPWLMLAVTEKRTKEEIDAFVSLLDNLTI